MDIWREGGGRAPLSATYRQQQDMKVPHEKPDPGDLSEWFIQTVESFAGPERSSVSDTALITQEHPPPSPPLPGAGLLDK